MCADVEMIRCAFCLLLVPGFGLNVKQMFVVSAY